MIMRRAAREECHILALNGVGIQRDDKKLREGVAKHCGLEIREGYKSDDEVEKKM